MGDYPLSGDFRAKPRWRIAVDPTARRRDENLARLFGPEQQVPEPVKYDGISPYRIREKVLR